MTEPRLVVAVQQVRPRH